MLRVHRIEVDEFLSACEAIFELLLQVWASPEIIVNLLGSRTAWQLTDTSPSLLRIDAPYAPCSYLGEFPGEVRRQSPGTAPMSSRL